MKVAKSKLKDIIYSHNKVLKGIPCFKGTRVPVKYVLEYLANGWSISEIKDSFPTVKSEYISKLIEVYSHEFNYHNEQI